VLEVPLSKAKLNPLARGRYVSTGPFQPLQVFAKIERVERKAGRWIVLTPIVILSLSEFLAWRTAGMTL
jgi:hypothetical protein